MRAGDGGREEKRKRNLLWSQDPQVHWLLGLNLYYMGLQGRGCLEL